MIIFSEGAMVQCNVNKKKLHKPLPDLNALGEKSVLSARWTNLRHNNAVCIILLLFFCKIIQN